MTRLPAGADPAAAHRKLERGLSWMALSGIATMTALIATVWSRLPETIPRHFDLAGNPDGFGPRMLIWTLPAIAALLFVVLSLAGYVIHRVRRTESIVPDNLGRRVALARELLGVIKVIIAWSFFWLTWESIASAMNDNSRISAGFLPLFLLVLFGTIVIYVVRIGRARTAGPGL